METKMNILKEYKGIVSLLTNTVNEAGNLDEISLKNSNRNKPALRHTAQPEPDKEVLEFKITKPNGFDSHASARRFKAPIEKSLLLETEETTFRTFGNEVFDHLN
jgi:hypothetical protein